MPTKPLSYTSEATRAAMQAAAAATNDYRALVCVFLPGGNDSHNMVLPTAASPNRAVYDSERGSLAVAAEAAPLNQLTTDWRLNPNMIGIKQLFDAGKAAVLMNVGYLKEPMDRAKYLAKGGKLPEQLFSHNTQQQLWQGLPAYNTSLVNTGWMGRATELAQAAYNPGAVNEIHSAFSVSGKAMQMQGYETPSNDMNTGGPTMASTGDGRTISGYDTARTNMRARAGTRSAVHAALSRRMRRAINNQSILSANLAALPTGAGSATAIFDQAVTDLTGYSSGQGLVNQLRIVARIIASRANYGHRRDCFYVSLGGWDDHASLATNYGPRVRALSIALKAFYDAMVSMNLGENAVAFTQSEFGRALKQNDGGSDHGWGGHALIVGGAVQGGVIYGTEPDLRAGSPHDAGQGRLIPQTSVEQYAATLLKWWGMPDAQMALVLPNLERFSPRDLGMLREPVSSIPTPTLRVDFTKDPSTWDSRFKYVSTNSATRMYPRTMIDASGKLRFARHNMCVNTDMDGVTLGVVTNGLTAIPGWSTSSGGVGTGITCTIKQVGVTAQGERFIDIQWKGTNTFGATVYPSINFSRAGQNSSYGAAYPLGMMTIMSCKAMIIAGSNVGFFNPPEIDQCFTTSVGAYVTEGTSAKKIDNTWTRHATAYRVPSGTAAMVHGRMISSVANGGTVDITIRFSQPMLEFVECEYDADAFKLMGDYVPNKSATTYYVEPRIQHDPATKQKLGLLAEQSTTNRIRNSCFRGGVPGILGNTDSALGPLGALPTYVTETRPTGIIAQFLGKGVEDGLPYIDLRIFGKRTGASPVGYQVTFDGSNNPGVATNTRVAASVYLRKLAGTFTGMSSAHIAIQQLDASNASTGTYRSTNFHARATDAPLLQQRVAVTATCDSATVAKAQFQLRLETNLNETVDVTLRIAAPQFEVKDAVTSWVPTYGAEAYRDEESVVCTGADFSSWYNSTQGTFVINGYSSVTEEEAPVTGFFPRLMSVHDLGGISYQDVIARAIAGGTGDIGFRVNKTDGSSAGEPIVSSADVPPNKASTRVVTYNGTALLVAQRGMVATVTASGTPVVDRASFPQKNGGWCLLRFFEYHNTALSTAQATLISSN